MQADTHTHEHTHTYTHTHTHTRTHAHTHTHTITHTQSHTHTAAATTTTAINNDNKNSLPNEKKSKIISHTTGRRRKENCGAINDEEISSRSGDWWLSIVKVSQNLTRTHCEISRKSRRHARGKTQSRKKVVPFSFGFFFGFFFTAVLGTDTTQEAEAALRTWGRMRKTWRKVNQQKPIHLPFRCLWFCLTLSRGEANVCMPVSGNWSFWMENEYRL